MSLRPAPLGPVPTETARGARAAFPQGHPCRRLREERGPSDDDARCAAVFPSRGRPVAAPWRLALVTVLPCAAGLRDRQAADAVRARLAWHDLRGRDLTDAGCACAIRSEFRARLVAGAAEQRLLAALLARCQAAGLGKPRGRPRTASPAVLAAVRARHRRDPAPPAGPTATVRAARARRPAAPRRRSPGRGRGRAPPAPAAHGPRPRGPGRPGRTLPSAAGALLDRRHRPPARDRRRRRAAPDHAGDDRYIILQQLVLEETSADFQKFLNDYFPASEHSSLLTKVLLSVLLDPNKVQILLDLGVTPSKEHFESLLKVFDGSEQILRCY